MRTKNFDEKINDIANGMTYTEFLTKWKCNPSNYYYLKKNYFDDLDIPRYQTPLQKEKYKDILEGMHVEEFKLKYNLKGYGSYGYIKMKLKREGLI